MNSIVPNLHFSQTLVLTGDALGESRNFPPGLGDMSCGMPYIASAKGNMAWKEAPMTFLTLWRLMQDRPPQGLCREAWVKVKLQGFLAFQQRRLAQTC